MDEKILKCCCPSCNNDRSYIWHHYDCPFHKLYISNKAIVRCENCGMQEELFNCKFDCGCHGDKPETVRFKSPSLKKNSGYVVVGCLEDEDIYSSDFIDTLCESIKRQMRKIFR